MIINDRRIGWKLFCFMVFVLSLGCGQKAFDKLGNFLFKTGSFGSDDGKFDNPLGVTVDGFRNFYVTDSSNKRIQKFDSSGGLLDIWNSSINATFSGF